MNTLRLIHWHTEEAIERATALKELGYKVDLSPVNNTSLRALRTNPPNAIVIDLTRLPSQGRDLGVTIRKRKATRQVPLIFVGGEDDKVARVKTLLPDARYATWETIADVLTKAIKYPPENPIVPDSGMAAYAGTPLPQKLGIKPGSVVGLIGAPPDFEQTLGELPAQVRLLTKPDSHSDLILWFVRSAEELIQDIDQIIPQIAGGGLWIIWPKKSVKKTGLSQAVVRKTGMDAGLVDYKISSIDATWSGLRFTYKK